MISEMSTWEERSEISRFNRLPADECLKIGTDFAEVLELALDIARRSNGAFDPALGREVARRGFGAQRGVNVGDAMMTGPEAWCHLELTDGMLCQPGGLCLDLSAIAKGFAVDRCARSLSDLGVNQCLIEIGGEFVGRGVKPDGLPWWVDLEGPSSSKDIRIAVCELAVATSGGWRQSRMESRHTLSHIVPARGQEDASLASVSVLHETCAAADAWATALFAIGFEGGAALAEAQGLCAILQTWAGGVHLSSAALELAG